MESFYRVRASYHSATKLGRSFILQANSKLRPRMCALHNRMLTAVPYMATGVTVMSDFLIKNVFNP